MNWTTNYLSIITLYYCWNSQFALVVKNPPANAGDIRDADSIPGSERSPGEGNGNPLQYPCLGNPMDRGSLQSTVHQVSKDSGKTEQLKNSNSIFLSLNIYWRHKGEKLLWKSFWSIFVLHIWPRVTVHFEGVS